MNFSLRTTLDDVCRARPYVVGAAAHFFSIYAVDRSREDRPRAAHRCAAVVATMALFSGCHSYVAAHARAADLTTAMVVITAAAFVFHEQRRAGQRRPVAERWKRVTGFALGVAAIVVCFNGFKFGYLRHYHRGGQSHYYMRAEYFREMRYSGLYKCSVVVGDALGAVSSGGEGAGLEGRFVLTREADDQDEVIRNLGGDTLIPVTDIPAHPEELESRPASGSSEQYKADVQLFRIASDKGYWENMEKDHGFNPRPVWTNLGDGFDWLALAPLRAGVG